MTICSIKKLKMLLPPFETVDLLLTGEAAVGVDLTTGFTTGVTGGLGAAGFATGGGTVTTLALVVTGVAGFGVDAKENDPNKRVGSIMYKPFLNQV